MAKNSLGPPSVPYAQQIRALTIDPGARRVGEVLDDMQAAIDALQAQVDSCCGETLAKKGKATHSNKPKSESNDSPQGTTTDQ